MQNNSGGVRVGEVCRHVVGTKLYLGTRCAHLVGSRCSARHRTSRINTISSIASMAIARQSRPECQWHLASYSEPFPARYEQTLLSEHLSI